MGVPSSSRSAVKTRGPAVLLSLGCLAMCSTSFAPHGAVDEYINRAFEERMNGHLESAQHLCELALGDSERIFDENPAEFALVSKALTCLSTVYVAQGRYSDAGPLLQRRVELHERFTDDSSLLYESLAELAALYSEWGSMDDAVSTWARMLNLAEEAPGFAEERELWLLTPLERLSQAAYARGRYAEALKLGDRFRNAYTAFNSLERLGTESPWLATVYLAGGRYERAEELHLLDLRYCRSRFGAESAQLATAFERYATFLGEVGREEEALGMRLNARKIRERTSDLSPTR